MRAKCTKCGADTEGFGGMSIGFRGVPPSGDGPPIKASPLPHKFKCEKCGHEWEKLPPTQPGFAGL